MARVLTRPVSASVLRHASLIHWACQRFRKGGAGVFAIALAGKGFGHFEHGLVFHMGHFDLLGRFEGRGGIVGFAAQLGNGLEQKGFVAVIEDLSGDFHRAIVVGGLGLANADIGEGGGLKFASLRRR